MKRAGIIGGWLVVCALVGGLLASAREDWFSIVVLPDTQGYTESLPAILVEQMRWIAAHQQRERIRLVLQVGDITQNNQQSEWNAADYAFSILDVRRIPYALCYGNHDVPAGSRDTARFNYAFGPKRPWRSTSWQGGWPAGTNDNSYHTFAAAGANWLVVCLEWYPRPEALEWANSVLSAHPKYQAIVMTHGYLDAQTGQRLEPYGERVWRDCASQHANVRMVLCGHSIGAARLESRGRHGNTVQQIVADYSHAQTYPASPGMLRLMRFRGGRVDARTLSPFTGEELEGPAHRFSVKLRSD